MTWTRRPRLSKFGNSPTRCREGVMHQSAKEARRCDELHLMQVGKLISDLEAHPQPRFRLTVNDVHICDVMPDFAYYDNELKRKRWEDVKSKGTRTEVYKLKQRLAMATLGVEIEEVM